MGNAECGMSGEASLGERPLTSIPHSAFRTPHSGWRQGKGGEVSRPHRRPNRRGGTRRDPRPRGRGGARGESRGRPRHAAPTPPRGRRVVDAGRRPGGGPGEVGQAVEKGAPLVTLASPEG